MTSERKRETQLADEAARELRRLGYNPVLRETPVSPGPGSRARADIVAWAADDSGHLARRVLVEVQAAHDPDSRFKALQQLATYSAALGTSRNFLFDGTWHEANASFGEYLSVTGPPPAAPSTEAREISRADLTELLESRLWHAAGQMRRPGRRPMDIPQIAQSIRDIFDDLMIAPEPSLAWGIADAMLPLLGAERGEFTTPEPLARAMARLLRPSDNSAVVDPACGLGGTLWAVSDYARRANLHISLRGLDVNPQLSELASTIAELVGMAAEVVTTNSLAGDIEVVNGIVCHPPMGALSSSPSAPFASVPSLEAAFVELVSGALAVGGRAVMLLSRRFLWGSQGAALRERLASERRVVAVIGLPQGVLEGTTIAPALLVIEHSDPTETLIAELEGDWEQQLSEAGPLMVAYLERLAPQ